MSFIGKNSREKYSASQDDRAFSRGEFSGRIAAKMPFPLDPAQTPHEKVGTHKAEDREGVALGLVVLLSKPPFLNELNP